MFSFVVFILVCFSCLKIYSEEYIFKFVRHYLDFKPFNCQRCLSFWVGFLLCFIGFPVIFNIWLSPFIYGLISYASNRIIDAFIIKNEFRITD